MIVRVQYILETANEIIRDKSFQKNSDLKDELHNPSESFKSYVHTTIPDILTTSYYKNVEIVAFKEISW